MKLPSEEWHVKQSLVGIRRLGRAGARFCRVYPGEKRPVGDDWQRKVYSSDDTQLLNWVRKPQRDSGGRRRGHTGNYGVVGGWGGITILDEDDERITKLREANLPETFVVSTCHDGKHSYFTIPNFGGSIRLQDPESPRTVVGDIQDSGKMVVGPGSVIYPEYDHKAGVGGFYNVVNDKPPAFVTESTVREAFGNFIDVWRKRTRTTRKRSSDVKANASSKIDITKIGKIKKAIENGDLHYCSGGKWNGYYVGSHPIHGSETGNNFHVIPKLNAWHCFRNGHNSGAGPYYWIAVEEELIDCSEAYGGSPVLQGDKFRRVIDIAVGRGLITRDQGRIIDVISPGTKTELGEIEDTFTIGVD